MEEKAEKKEQPGKKENSGLAKWLTACFFLLLLGTGGFGGILSGLFGGERGSDSMEKRTLARSPEFSLDNISNIPSETEEWLNDHAPFREQWLDLYASMNYSLFQSVDDSRVIVGKDSWFFYNEDGSLSEMIGVLPFTEEQMEAILQDILLVREQYVERPEDFIFFLAPDKEKIYDCFLPDGFENRTGTSRAAELVRYIREHSDIRVVYPVESLKQAAEGENLLYYRADTHWNGLGAFVGVQELLAALGYERTELDSLEITEKEINSGDITLLGHLPNRYVKDAEPSYRGYLNSVTLTIREDDLEKSGIKRTAAQMAPVEKKLVLIRDSFGKSMEPAVCRYFGEVTEVDRNKLDEIPKSVCQGDILVFEIVERQLEALSGNLKSLLE